MAVIFMPLCVKEGGIYFLLTFIEYYQIFFKRRYEQTRDYYPHRCLTIKTAHGANW